MFGSRWFEGAERGWVTQRRDVQNDLLPQVYVGKRPVVVAGWDPFDVGSLASRSRS